MISTTSITMASLTLCKALQHVRREPLLFAAGAALGAIPLLSYIYKSYSGFIALGPSGLTQDIRGWLLQMMARPWADGDTTSLGPYTNPKVKADYLAPFDNFSALTEESVPARRGDRPVIAPYVVPHRQTSETADLRFVTRMNAWLLTLEQKNPNLLSFRNSNLEHKDNPSLWLNVDSVTVPEFMSKKTRGEIAHVHNEGSMHIVLSAQDAELATRQGWAERHSLSGRLNILPVSYVLIYAPRDEDELEQWKEFVKASVAFTSAATGIKVDYDV